MMRSADVCVASLLLVLSFAAPARAETLEDYASNCDKLVGVTVPKFNCDDGTLVPTTHHADGKCDRPQQLNQYATPAAGFRF